MNNINRVLLNMALVEARASGLNCTVIAVLNNVILCHRSDNTYVTWKCSIQHAGTAITYRAVFDSGDYDMTLESGRESLMVRANWKAEKSTRQVIEDNDGLCLDSAEDRETLINALIKGAE